jgi:hypothetical protein
MGVELEASALHHLPRHVSDHLPVTVFVDLRTESSTHAGGHGFEGRTPKL